MILLATIFRLVDGLPLSATTDLQQSNGVKACQKYIKLISRKLTQLPDRCTLNLEGFKIHFISALDQAFLVLVEEEFPTVLAFCYLDEIQREFLINYNSNKVQNVRRPYSIIEFDNFLQKTKQRYNNPRTLTTRINLSDMSHEIRLRPPYQITEEDLQTTQINGFLSSNGSSTFRPAVGPGSAMMPIDWIGMLAVALNIFCTLLNFTRGMAIISHGHFDEEDSGAYRYGTAFLVACGLSLYQIYLIFFHSHWRKQMVILLFVWLCCCHIIVHNFRNVWQILFHFATNIFITWVLMSRQIGKKLPGYNV